MFLLTETFLYIEAITLKEAIMAAKIPTRLYLSEDEIPKYWYNIKADMKNKPEPLLHPGTLKPATASDLESVFCKGPIQQELDDTTRLIPIPEGIQEFTGPIGRLLSCGLIFLKRPWIPQRRSTTNSRGPIPRVPISSIPPGPRLSMPNKRE